MKQLQNIRLKVKRWQLKRRVENLERGKTNYTLARLSRSERNRHLHDDTDLWKGQTNYTVARLSRSERTRHLRDNHNLEQGRTNDTFARLARRQRNQSQNRFQRWAKRLIGGGFALLVLVALSPLLINVARETTWSVWQMGNRLFGQSDIAPLFTAPVQYWGADITRWSQAHDLDPNLMATVMQIESCGHPSIASNAGAQGLFQVMPFHFDDGENYIDPDTNALRSANFLNYCLDASNGDVGLTLACYNGGPSVINRAFHTWANETQRYYLWGMGIYSDAQRMDSTSHTLNSWLNAGGARLCTLAEQAIGLPMTIAENSMR